MPSRKCVGSDDPRLSAYEQELTMSPSGVSVSVH